MRILLIIFVALLPFHALLINFLKCKLGIPEEFMNIARFWKEILLFVMMLGVIVNLYKKYKFNISLALKNNYLIGSALAFIICSFIYIFFPFFDVKMVNLLGFKYDVFFFFAMFAGVYLLSAKQNFDTLLKTTFISIGTMLVVFLPWYMFGDISLLSDIFGYSDKVSTYEANGCTAFAQNVNGVHRFQGTFGGPIRFSVFLTIFFFVYLGYILDFLKRQKNVLKYALYIGIPSIFYLLSLFFAYTKTSLLGFMIGLFLFVILAFRENLKHIPKKVYLGVLGIFVIGLLGLVIVKHDLFLHIGSTLNRIENLEMSLKMFSYNPIGYGLGIAGPASVVEVRFWPENWYIQILLEQGIWGLALFVGALSVIGVYLWRIMKKKKDFFSIGMFVAFISLCLMANLTHAFEESATSYTLFLLIGIYIANNLKFNEK